ncbi:hypothetical protein NPIL_2131, partial [Nephila pilipes]
IGSHEKLESITPVVYPVIIIQSAMCKISSDALYSLRLSFSIHYISVASFCGSTDLGDFSVTYYIGQLLTGPCIWL